MNGPEGKRRRKKFLAVDKVCVRGYSLDIPQALKGEHLSALGSQTKQREP